MELEKLLEKRKKYVASQGGYTQLIEGDEVLNELNIKIIEAFKKEHDDCCLVKIHPKDDEDCVTPYTDQVLKNFACDAVIPKNNKILRDLIILYNQPHNKSIELLNNICDSIEENGGIYLIWK